MDAVTYPDAKVAEFLSKHMICVRVPFNAKPLSDDYKVKWTPTIIVLDPEGHEHHRTVGFLPPEELIPSLALGEAKAYFDHDQFDRAIPLLDRLVESFGKSDAAAEAVYLRGVSRYKSTHDAKPLKEAYEKLQADFPHSEWAKRSQPYRLL